MAVRDGATEIDIVINRTLALTGKWEGRLRQSCVNPEKHSEVCSVINFRFNQAERAAINKTTSQDKKLKQLIYKVSLKRTNSTKEVSGVSSCCSGEFTVGNATRIF